MVWSYLGDALWILALAIMFGASRQAWRRVPPGARAPLLGVRLPRGVAIWGLPGAAFIFSLGLLLQARTWENDPNLALLTFGVRALSASLVALLHLRLLGATMAALERDRQLKP